LLEKLADTLVLYAFSFLFVTVTMKESLLLSGLTTNEGELQNTKVCQDSVFFDSTLHIAMGI